MDVPLPPGCTLEATIPGEDDAFGILYQNSQRALGAVIWDGFASQVRGVEGMGEDGGTGGRGGEDGGGGRGGGGNGGTGGVRGPPSGIALRHR